VTTYLRWRDEDGKKHVSSAPSPDLFTLDMVNADPLRAGMEIVVNGVTLILSDPDRPA
jgi:hypothetical protein